MNFCHKIFTATWFKFDGKWNIVLKKFKDAKWKKISIYLRFHRSTLTTFTQFFNYFLIFGSRALATWFPFCTFWFFTWRRAAYIRTYRCQFFTFINGRSAFCTDRSHLDATSIWVGFFPTIWTWTWRRCTIHSEILMANSVRKKKIFFSDFNCSLKEEVNFLTLNAKKDASKKNCEEQNCHQW